jgi:hypothetical protein
MDEQGLRELIEDVRARHLSRACALDFPGSGQYKKPFALALNLRLTTARRTP